MKYKIKKINENNDGNYQVEIKIIIEDASDYEHFYDILQDDINFDTILENVCINNQFVKEDE